MALLHELCGFRLKEVLTLKLCVGSMDDTVMRLEPGYEVEVPAARVELLHCEGNGLCLHS
jgi:hypothetical protein